MHSPSTDIKQMQRACLAAAFVALGISGYMAWEFGSSISRSHGVALVVACFLASIIWTFRKIITDAGVKGRWITVAAVFFVGLELMSHLGYTFGMRDKQVVEAGAQTVAYRATQDNLTSHRTNLDMWRTQLADLQARNKAIASKNNGWLITVDPVAMQSQLDAMDQKIANEAARVRCADKCEALKTQRGQLAALISAVKEENDLTTRIDATQRIVDNAVTKATTTKIGHSTTKAQNNAFGELLRLASTFSADEAFEPEARAKSMSERIADLLIGTMMAIGATGAPALLFYFAFFAPPGLPRILTDNPLPAPTPNTTHTHTETATITQPIEVSIPLTIKQEAQAQPVPQSPRETFRKIGKVADTAFARRVAQITQQYHQQAIA